MASEAGSTTDIEPDDRLRDWLTAYINKLQDNDKQRLGFNDWLECRDGIAVEMLREYGDLRSVLREVEVNKVWRILMSVTTGSQNYIHRLGRRRYALFESVRAEHDDITKTIIEYLTPGQILQFLQLQDDGEKYLYSQGFPSSLPRSPLLLLSLSMILHRLPEVSQRYELLSIRDWFGRTKLHYRAEKEILESLESQELCFQLLSTQDNKGQTPLFTIIPSGLKRALDSVTVEQRLTLINMRDNEGQTAAEYYHRQISEQQSEYMRSFPETRLAVIEYCRREARIQIVMSTHDDDGECESQ